MLLIECWVEGTMPILLNRPTEEALSGRTRTTNPGEEDDPRDIAEKNVYRLPRTKQLAIPGAAISRMLREAGGSHKVKGSRKSLKYLVPAAVVVMDDLLGLFLNDRQTPIVEFEIDSRPVTIPSTKGRIMRHRARCNEWSCKIRMRINEAIIDAQMIRKLLIEGCSLNGLGDFRPEKGGPFGLSDVVQWEIISAAKPKSVAQIHAAE